MGAKEQTTILVQIAQHPALLALVLDGRNSNYESYISNLIFESEEIAARRHIPWDYKSLLHYGEEGFVSGGSFRVMYDFHGDNPNVWHRQAAMALASEVTRSVVYEDEEGLVLFVRDGNGYRPATLGDPAYAHVKRLFADGNLSDISIDKPLSWAEELFVSKNNLDAYACLWYDLDYISKPGREDLKRVRREAVWRETLRRMGREPFAGLSVPAPAQWASAELAANDRPTGLQSLDAPGTMEIGINRPLSTRERDTLLTIIAALCKEAKLDYSKPAKTAGLIRSTAAGMGVSIGETTIENHLKKIPDALGARTR